MHKIIWSILIVCCAVSISCHRHKTPQGNLPAPNGNFSTIENNPIQNYFSVNGCASKTGVTKTVAEKMEVVKKEDLPALKLPVAFEIPTIIAQGDSIIYTRETEHLCCRVVQVITNTKVSNINIQEYWSHRGCKCKCSSALRVVLPKIPKGTYMVYAIVKETDPVTDIDHGIQDTIKRQEIVIR